MGADAGQISLLFAWFGAFGLIGNVLLSRYVDRIGAARAVALLLVAIAVSLVAWPWALGVGAMALVLLPWGFACFSSNSAQQARLGIAAPALAPALMALNTSAIYAGQAIGAAGGGAIVLANEAAGRATYAGLHWVGLAWIALALGTSLWAARRMQGRAHV
jgi:predicted MFS family arabinose efflux permease